MWWIIGTIIVIIVFFTFVRFTIVKEGTAKTIVRLGQFRKAVIAWEEYKLDKEWEVEKGWSVHLPGGLRFVGIWPLDKVYKYNFRWRDIQLVQGEEKVEFHEGLIDYVFVRQDVYWTELKKAETVPPERIPANIQFLVTVRITNPYKVLFRAPSNWNENLMAKINALFRDWVGRKTLDEVLSARQSSLDLLREFETDPLIANTFKSEWGVTIEGIQIRDVELPKEYQSAAAKEKEMDLLAKGRAAETIGTVIEMMARARGKKPQEIQQEIEKNPKLRNEFLRTAHDLVIRKMGMEAGAYTDIRVTGAEGVERTILNALAVWRRMPGGQSGQGAQTTEKEEEIPDLDQVLDELK